MESFPITLKSGRPNYLVFDHDLAGLAGNILRHHFNVKNHILDIDVVTLHDLDFTDLSKVLEASGTVPVTIKSLVFQFSSGCCHESQEEESDAQRGANVMRLTGGAHDGAVGCSRGLVEECVPSCTRSSCSGGDLGFSR